MSSVPAPFRAALGFAATIVEDYQRIPDRALQLPVIVLSTAMQLSLRAQQHYAALTSKGDEVLASIRGIPEEPPEWAQFDELPPITAVRHTADDQSDDRPDDRSDDQAADDDAPDVPVTPINRRPSSRPRASGSNAIKPPRTGAPSAFDRVADDEV